MDQEWQGWEVHKARFLDGLFVGMAFPCKKSTVDGGEIDSEIIHKFNRKALKRMKREEDRARQKREHANRYAKLVAFYHDEENILNERSPFEE